MVKISSYYGNSASAENNAKVVTLPNGDKVWFSYETMVAYMNGETMERKVIKNYWGTTTGKHLNAIDGGDKEAKAKRVDTETLNAFAKACQEMVA